MATSATYNVLPQKRRPESTGPPVPIAISSYSKYQPESLYRKDSPLTPYSDSTLPFFESDNRSLGERDRRFYGAGGGGTVNGSGFSDNIPLTSPIERNNAELDTLQQDQSQGGKSLPSPVSHRRRRRRREPEKRGFFQGKVPWVVYTFTLIQLTVFIVEIVKNSILTGSPIEIHPQVNPMLGPSIYVLINMGARYVPCMRSTDGIQNSQVAITWPCPNTTSSDVNSPMNQCQLSDLCGFSPVPNPKVGDTLDTQPQPNQWFRFIIPMFLHAGIIHIAFNMLLQLTLGREMEKIIGSVRFLIVYLSSGIFGFVMGGNFAPSGIASTGASGALFGIIAIMLLDLLYTWKERRSPWKELAFIALDIIVSFVLGLLPGLDNFAHIGGFLMGLVLGVCILRSPIVLRERVSADESPYSPVTTKPVGVDGGRKDFAKQPVGFFKGRKLFWWAWWLVRVAALIGVLVCFVVLLNNFYKYRTTCSWCKYLSCLNVNNWCDVGNIQLQNINSTTSRRRDLFDSFVAAQLLESYQR